ncbi:hypothetical protein K456DRAFT_1171590 [Colletotrichum gloeosporioides 23]|nr:hypothetical protein K456DRAFT_1171590 [Colletotrichum gloeosporioides 23]
MWMCGLRVWWSAERRTDASISVRSFIQPMSTKCRTENCCECLSCSNTPCVSLGAVNRNAVGAVPATVLMLLLQLRQRKEALISRLQGISVNRSGQTHRVLSASRCVSILQRIDYFSPVSASARRTISNRSCIRPLSLARTPQPREIQFSEAEKSSHYGDEQQQFAV